MSRAVRGPSLRIAGWVAASFLSLMVAGLAPLVGADAAADFPEHFPLDFLFDVPHPQTASTTTNKTFIVHSESPNVRADLEDFDLVAAQYEVHVRIKPPGCQSPANWFDGGWNLPDYADLLAPIEWGAECDPTGLWTIEVSAEAAPMATGGLRVHLSEF